MANYTHKILIDSEQERGAVISIFAWGYFVARTTALLLLIGILVLK